MKRLISLGLIGAMLCLVGCVRMCPASSVNNVELNKMIEKDRNATVMLVDPDKEHAGEYLAYCSGVWINSEEVLTAYHCVNESDEEIGTEVGKEIRVSFYQDYRIRTGMESAVVAAHKGIVIKIDPHSDLALVRVESGLTNTHGTADIGWHDILDGDSVIIVGHPIGLSYVWVPGTVVRTDYAKHPNGEVVKVLHITSSAYFGNSGGPAFDTEGNVIGICSFLMRGPLMTFFIHRDVLVNFLRG